MTDKYDRQGRPLALPEWIQLFEDREYKIIGRFEDERVLISTVWLGLDHNWGGGPPLIFETMIFFKEDRARQKEWSDNFRATVDFSDHEKARDGIMAAGDYPEAVNALHDSQWRWHTEEEAREGHKIIVACYQENLDPYEAIRKWRRGEFAD